MLIGIVTGLFCTLIVAGLCSHFFQIDWNWYSLLTKPEFVYAGGFFKIAVSIVYFSNIWVISKLVRGKHIFPSMFLLALKGFFCILFVYVFFKKQMLALGLIFLSFVFLLSFSLFIRFLIKDGRTALAYFPTFLFNAYSFVIMVAIVMAN